MLRLTILIAAAIFLTGCPDLPMDQHGTFQHITDTAKMRIGVIENPPWVIRTQGEPAGVEVELMRRFAKNVGVEPEWQWGGEANLMPTLENYELDAVIGGIGDKTPWSARVGITRYYFTEKYDVGNPPGMTIDSLSDKQISVHDSRVAGLIRKKGSVPVMVSSVEDVKAGPVAAADWQIAKMGLAPAGFDLETDRHVIAVPSGENQLIMRLEKFLSSQYNEIPAILAAQPEVHNE